MSVYQIPTLILIDLSEDRPSLSSVSVDLMNKVDLRVIDHPKIKIKWRGVHKIETNQDSPIYQLIHRLRSKKIGRHGVDLVIELGIPLSSGLLTDYSLAVQLTLLLNELWNIYLTQKELSDLFSEFSPISERIFFYLQKEGGHFSSKEVVVLQPKNIKVDCHWILENKINDSIEQTLFHYFPDIKSVFESFKSRGFLVDLAAFGPCLLVTGDPNEVQRELCTDFPDFFTFFPANTCHSSVQLID